MLFVPLLTDSFFSSDDPLLQLTFETNNLLLAADPIYIDHLTSFIFAVRLSLLLFSFSPPYITILKPTMYTHRETLLPGIKLFFKFNPPSWFYSISRAINSHFYLFPIFGIGSSLNRYENSLSIYPSSFDRDPYKISWLSFGSVS